MGLKVVRPDPFSQNSLIAARAAIAGREEGWLAPFSSVPRPLSSSAEKSLHILT